MISSSAFHPIDPLFAEGWFAGTYVVSGIFFRDGHEIAPQRIREDIESLFEEVENSKRAIWPRGVAGFYVIPIYCASGFQKIPEIGFGSGILLGGQFGLN